MTRMAILTSPTDGRTEEQAYARRWWTLAVLCLSLLIVFGGNSTLNVALPTLSRDLGATESQLQWVVAIYSLVFAGLLFTSGALGDRFGRKGALQFGLATFFLASLFASQATDVTQIIACRAAMGVGAAFIMPATLSILVNVFPPHERAKAIAIWATTTGIAGSIGPVITGWVLGHFWFGAAFLVYLPVIAVAFVGGWFFVPKSRDPNESAIDPLGALLSIVGIAALVYGFIEAPDKGWVAPVTIAAFATAVVVLTLFVLWELHTEVAHARHAVLPQPRVQRGQRRHDAGVPGHVRRDAAHDAVLPARARVLRARRRHPVVAHRADHADRHAVHAAHRAALRRQPVGRVRHVPDRARVRALHAADHLDAVLVLLAVPRTVDDRRVAVDGADDGIDHVGGAREPRRCGLGDERRDA